MGQTIEAKFEVVETKGIGPTFRESEPSSGDNEAHQAFVRVIDALFKMGDQHAKYASLIRDGKGGYNICLSNHPRMLTFEAGERLQLNRGLTDAEREAHQPLEYLFPESVSEIVARARYDELK